MATVDDVVLIYFEEQALSFARIEEILPDSKPGWYHVKLLLLQVPLQVVTWILREAYINGEGFTMGGNRIRLESVVCPESLEPSDQLEVTPAGSSKSDKPAAALSGDNVISLADKIKKQ